MEISLGNVLYGSVDEQKVSGGAFHTDCTLRKVPFVLFGGTLLQKMFSADTVSISSVLFEHT